MMCVRTYGARYSPLVILALVSLAEVEARDCRPNLIPNGNKFGCSNCHLSFFGGGTRTPFGEAVFPLVWPLVGFGCNPFWSPALAARDSDGDGKTNGEELGDPDGKWTPGAPSPGNRALVTNPGVRSFIRGDFNTDGQVNIADAIATLEYLFLGGPASMCRAAADANNDIRDSIDISDALVILFHLFATGVNLPPPFPDCGNNLDDNNCRSSTCL